MNSRHPETNAISAGRPAHKPGAGMNAPISMNSTFVANGDLSYGRFGNESWSALEEAITLLEHGNSTLAFSSGMAAISAVFSLLPHGAPVVASDQGYSGTMALLKKYHEQGRLDVRFIDIANTKDVFEALMGAAFLWIESPTNPGLEIAEMAVIIGEAKKRNMGVAVDNTFATPLNQLPLELGADISMNSVTKYLAGHSDVILGSLTVKDPALHSRLQEARSLLGAIPGPFEAWLALRGIRTFPLRFKAAQSTAAALVEKLRSHSKITKVRYPGFGAIISFEVDADVDGTDKVCESTTLITNATSLGGVESTWERRRRWPAESESVPENLIRLSVGCEHIDDLWADISSALATIY
ncbi:MAG: trans-sulfuration enzyme family protein [Candidatus Planktophila sp.]